MAQSLNSFTHSLNLAPPLYVLRVLRAMKASVWPPALLRNPQEEEIYTTASEVPAREDQSDPGNEEEDR